MLLGKRRRLAGMRALVWRLLRLHRLLTLRLRPMRACGPPTLGAGPTFQESASSSSPAGAGARPCRLSSLLCFLLSEQKTSIKDPRRGAWTLLPLLPVPCSRALGCALVFVFVFLCPHEFLPPEDHASPRSTGAAFAKTSGTVRHLDRQDPRGKAGLCSSAFLLL